MDDIVKQKWLDLLEDLEIKTSKLYQYCIDNDCLTDEARIQMGSTKHFIEFMQSMIEFNKSIGN